MNTQIRIYTINRGKLAQFAAEWQAHIRPLREKLGFRILGAWTLAENNQFVWLLHYAGERSFAESDAAYYQHPERVAMDPNPARLIARAEEYFVEPFRLVD